MNKIQEQVLEFHRVYEVPKRIAPGFPKPERVQLRQDLIQEEFTELCDAFVEQDLAKVVDAIGDLLYVTFGTAIEFGIDMEPVMDEIQRSNLSKLGLDGKPVIAKNGKVMKGPKFFEPDIKKKLREQGWKSR